MKYFFTLLILFSSIASSGFPQTQPKNPPPIPPLTHELIRDYREVLSKLLALLETFEDKHLAWRPSPGVRATREVFVHIAATNLVLPTTAGIKPPIEPKSNMEKTITDREEIRKLLLTSFDHVIEHLQSSSPAELQKPITLFGRKTSVLFMYVRLLGHCHEHLGQLIAYTRVNGLVPPWSRQQPRRTTPPSP